MSKRRAFTLIELLVVIATIALLLAILMPSLSKARRQSKSVVCQMNLHHWGYCFTMYANDNDGRFMRGWTDDYSGDWGFGKQWMNQLRKYYSDQMDFALCPMTRRPDEDSRGLGGTFGAWANLGAGDGAVMEGDYGSYGINDWCYNPAIDVVPYIPEPDYVERQGTSYPPQSFYWRGLNVKGANKVPLFFDCIWTDAWPDDWCPPPTFFDYADMTDASGQQMQRVCIKRHDAAINMLFLDNTVRSVGLKELWVLNWHKHFDICNMYTQCGGATWREWEVWALWMKNFKDY
ncbi:type II secretion system protein [Planctomycetota bacterium]